jgi:Ca-activated chloride channel family protein
VEARASSFYQSIKAAFSLPGPAGGFEQNDHPSEDAGSPVDRLFALRPGDRARATARAQPNQDGTRPCSKRSARAEKKSPPLNDGGLVIKEQTEVVTLTVTVTDRHQQPVTGLERQDFEVYEDKVKQEIEFFAHTDEAASIGVIFDLSASMERKLGRAREALKAFAQTSHPEDDFFLVTFNRRAHLLADFSDGEMLGQKLATALPSGPTALYDAVYLGLEKVKQGRHPKRALLVISDGEDNASRYKLKELRQLIKESDVQIYGIGIFEGISECGRFCRREGQITLSEIAELTGGKAFFPDSGAELEEVIMHIARELRQQYSLGYTPSRAQRDGQWRKIQVRVTPVSRELSRLTVRAREGYYAAP